MKAVKLGGHLVLKAMEHEYQDKETGEKECRGGWDE